MLLIRATLREICHLRTRLTKNAGLSGPRSAGRWTARSQICIFATLRIDLDLVPKTKVALYREEDGSCPFVEWFGELPPKVQDKCYLRLERLREMGHGLRRPEADFLRDGIYELRVSLGRVHHRILYFFHGAMAAVVSHGLCEGAGGPAERDRSCRRAQEAV